MANGTVPSASEQNFGALQQRVYSIETGQQSLVNSLNGLQSRVESLFTTLTTKIEDRARPQYGLLVSIGGLALLAVSAVGGLAYLPIRENQTDLKIAAVENTKAIAKVAEMLGDNGLKWREAVAASNEKTAKEFVSVRELDARSARTQTDISRILQDISALENAQVPRVEQAERTRTVDNQFVNLQRQIDDLKKAFGDTYSLRDVIQSMQRELDRLRSERKMS